MNIEPITYQWQLDTDGQPCIMAQSGLVSVWIKERALNWHTLQFFNAFLDLSLRVDVVKSDPSWGAIQLALFKIIHLQYLTASDWSRNGEHYAA